MISVMILIIKGSPSLIYFPAPSVNTAIHGAALACLVLPFHPNPSLTPLLLILLDYLLVGLGANVVRDGDEKLPAHHQFAQTAFR